MFIKIIKYQQALSEQEVLLPYKFIQKLPQVYYYAHMKYHTDAQNNRMCLSNDKFRNDKYICNT